MQNRIETNKTKTSHHSDLIGMDAILLIASFCMNQDRSALAAVNHALTRVTAEAPALKLLKLPQANELPLYIRGINILIEKNHPKLMGRNNMKISFSKNSNHLFAVKVPAIGEPRHKKGDIICLNLAFMSIHAENDIYEPPANGPAEIELSIEDAKKAGAIAY